MLKSYQDALFEKVREILQQGYSIGIVGWRDSNHNNFTKQLLTERRIFFIEASATHLPEKIGFILFTRFVYHKQIERLIKNKPYHPVPLHQEIIKKILESCKDLLESRSND